MNKGTNGSDRAKRYTRVHLQSSDDGLVSEASVCISYENDQEFAQKFHQIIQSLFSPAAQKQQVSVREIKDGFVITSEQPGGGDLNNQLGKEVTLDE